MQVKNSKSDSLVRSPVCRLRALLRGKRESSSKRHERFALSIVLLLFSSALLFSDEFREYELQLETPEEGSAVGIESPDEYERLTARDSQAKLVRESFFVSIPEKPVTNSRSMDQDMVVVSRTKNGGAELARRAALKAEEFLKKKVRKVTIKGRTIAIHRDCSNFVRAAYYFASDKKVDIFAESIESGAASARTSSGVVLISKYFEKYHQYNKRQARVGDLIIFDNTYDKNRNRKRDDYLTHVGIVTGIRKDSTIEFIHGNAGREIRRGYINFEHANVTRKNGTNFNSYLRPRYRWERERSRNLTSHLVRAFSGYSY